MDLPVYISTYTQDSAPGIYRVDLQAGRISNPQPVATVVNPSFLAWHPSRRFLYLVNEAGKFLGTDGGGVTAFAVGAAGAPLTILNEQSTGSPGACHLAVDATGVLLVAANYSGGSVSVFPIQPDGTLSPRSDFHEHTGSGPHPTRQKRPHAHGITFSPDNRFVLVPDLGTDAIWIYRVQLDKQALELHGKTASAPGAGPRHVVFSPDGRHAYAVNELDNTVTAYGWDADAGKLSTIGSVRTLPDDWTGESTTAEIVVAPSGRWVIASNRGHDSLSVFARDPESGRLTLRSIQPCGGKKPRSFAMSPDESKVVAAYQASDAVELFTFDTASGRLTPVAGMVNIPKPACVLF